MIIIIDAYNLLKQLLGGGFISKPNRIAFINKIRRYADSKKHNIILVFDGGTEIWSFKERVGRVTVVYSGSSHTADDFIESYIIDNRGKNLLLVSSDTKLQKCASDCGMASICSLEFYKFLISGSKKKYSSKRNLQIKKIALDENQELDALMESAKVDGPKEEDFIEGEKIVIKKKLSKEEKKIFKILKKL